MSAAGDRRLQALRRLLCALQSHIRDSVISARRVHGGKFARVAGVTAADFRAALAAKTTPRTLHSFTPNPGDCVFLDAGTVHAIGADVFLFEVQQTSDITYRLYDWDRVDAKTKRCVTSWINICTCCGGSVSSASGTTDRFALDKIGLPR